MDRLCGGKKKAQSPGSPTKKEGKGIFSSFRKGLHRTKQNSTSDSSNETSPHKGDMVNGHNKMNYSQMATMYCNSGKPFGPEDLDDIPYIDEVES